MYRASSDVAWGESRGKVRLHPWQWAVVLIALLLSIADLLFPAVAQFFAQHAVFSAVLTSLLFLVIGYTVVDWLLAEQERRRWSRIRRIGLVAIGRGALNQRRAMQYSVMLEALHIDADFAPLDAYDAVAKAIDRCLSWTPEQQSSPEEIAAVNQVSEVESGMILGDELMDEYERRLSIFLADPDWRHAAYLLLREAGHSMNRLIGRWVPALCASAHGMDVLTIVSDQADRLDELARRLDDRSLGDSQELPLESLWVQEQINALLLYEWLMSQAKELDYFSSARKAVPRRWKPLIPPAPGGGVRGVRLAIRENGTVAEEPLRP